MLIRQQRGFSLAEMAIVLVIVGILMASGLGALSSQMSNQRLNETKLALDRANEALLGYALSHNRLPCPADNAGLELVRNGAGDCPQASGNLPWLDLGLPEFDAWGRHLQYRVTPIFARKTATCGDLATPNSAPCFTLQTAGDNTVKSASRRNGAPVTASNLISSAAPAAAIIFSEGASGAGAGADELENRNGDVKFIQDTPDEDFDDLLVWLPTSTLLYRLSAVGKWN
ncbi:type II secretion system protein [Deefgea rivuli]|uniref:type II secretion system protein n=1 Tax=Deefgea rivuli TaxID=400948 RepID=UPI000481B0C1|nr:type II secretion system protein [Deefgea rivuli]